MPVKMIWGEVGNDPRIEGAFHIRKLKARKLEDTRIPLGHLVKKGEEASSDVAAEIDALPRTREKSCQHGRRRGLSVAPRHGIDGGGAEGCKIFRLAHHHSPS